MVPIMPSSLNKSLLASMFLVLMFLSATFSKQLWYKIGWRTENPNTTPRSSTMEQSFQIGSDNTSTKLGDGCYHIFLDMGSNVGVHGRFLLEPDKYKRAGKAHAVFNKHFGPVEKRNNSDFCVFAFEPNSAHKARQLELQQVYGKLGWRYHFEPVALSDVEGNLIFYHQDNGKMNEWGFSTHAYEKEVPWAGQEGKTNETVPSIRFAKWMEENIQNRIIPEEPNNKDALPPTVVMKFDIEGSEYEVVFDLLFSGLLCDIVDYTFGELHPWTTRKKLMEEVIKVFNEQKDGNCKTKRIDLFDDESYIMDGIPLPDVPE